MRPVHATLLALFGFMLACTGSVETTPTTPAKVIAGAGTSASPLIADCWTTAKDLGKPVGSSEYVSCPAGCTTGMIWGTGRYTGDSKVCVAAIHAGAMNNGAAGTAIVKIEGVYGNFVGSPANGITSQSWTSAQDLTFSVTSAAPTAPTAPEPAGDPGERGGKAGKGKAGKAR